MTSPLADKLDFALKALSMSRGRMAAELGVDKSAVGRWVSGAAAPSAHNMSQLTAVVAARAPGFTALDWERDLEGLAEAIGVAPPGPRRAAAPPAPSLSIPLLAESLDTMRRRRTAYQGFYRSTRPYAQYPGQFVHDQVLLREDPSGFLKMTMICAGVRVEGQAMLLQNQLFFAGAELTSGAFVFSILNGVSTVQAGVIDGIVLYCALDPGRTPTATAAVFERTGDVSGDAEADDARLLELSEAEDYVATEASAPAAIRAYLVRDLGPAQMASGGWLLQMPLIHSLARGLNLPERRRSA
jgi:hypothetical protein